MNEQVPVEEDPELNAMKIVFGALRALDQSAQDRVLGYVAHRLGRELRLATTSVAASSGAAQGDTRADSASSDEDIIESAGSEQIGGSSGAGPVLEGVSPVAQKWMTRNGMNEHQLSALFSLGVDEIDLVAKKVPGDSARERLHSILLLQGVASYLGSGSPRIDKEKLKLAINHYDADVGGNFASCLKSWASEISGSRAAGNLTLTTRGLNSAKEIINELIGASIPSA